MEAKVVLFEGFDGAGKTTLIEDLAAHLEKQGVSVLVIGEEVSKSIANITSAMKYPDIDVTSSAEILLRLAREVERTKLLNENRARYDFILIDRGLPSLLSWIAYYNESPAKYEGLVADLREGLGPCYFVYCRLDFDSSWTRILARGHVRPLSRREAKGREVNRSFWSIQQEAFANFGGQRMTKYEIDMKVSPQDALRALLECPVFSG